MQIFEEKQENLLQENIKTFEEKQENLSQEDIKTLKNIISKYSSEEKKRNICRRFKTNKAQESKKETPCKANAIFRHITAYKIWRTHHTVRIIGLNRNTAM